MGSKFQKYERRQMGHEPVAKIHPIWRGIGCIIMLFIPVMAYAGSVIFIDLNREAKWIRVPADLMKTVRIPYIGAFEHLGMTLVTTFLLAILGFGVFVIIYSLIYSVVGPPRYGPLDVPELRRPKRKR